MRKCGGPKYLFAEKREQELYETKVHRKSLKCTKFKDFLHVVNPAFTPPPFPLFQWYPQSKEIL
jgi:hypothetical protein